MQLKKLPELITNAPTVDYFVVMSDFWTTVQVLNTDDTRPFPLTWLELQTINYPEF